MSPTPAPPSTRASRRIQHKRQVQEAQEVQSAAEAQEQALSVHWNPREHQKLLLGLKRYGSRAIPLIHAQYLPHRPFPAVQHRIRNLKRLQNFSPCARVDSAKIYQRPREAPIENWIELIEARFYYQPRPGFSRLPCDMMELISRYEAHPPMNTPEDVDYGAIYRALAELMRGEVPRDLNAATSQKMSQLMSKLLLYVQANSRQLAQVKAAVADYRIPRDFDQSTVRFDPAAYFNDFDFPLALFRKDGK